jgi:hypothetical protein
MADESMDLGTVQVLLDRLNKQRLPRLLELKTRVDRGEKLGDLDITHMQEALAGANQLAPLIKRNPEVAPLVARVIGLYKEVADKALENEKKT